MQFRFLEPAQDFSDGLDVLSCYHRVFLDLGGHLLELAESICREGMNEARAHRCVELHCFYLRANALHHRDEEYALFPLLLNRSQLINGMIERLALDHEEIEEVWDTLAGYLSRPEHIEDTRGLLACAQTFEKVQREHLKREDEDFLPQARRVLAAEHRVSMARTMLDMRRN